MTREICPHVRHGVAALALLAFVITPSIALAQTPSIDRIASEGTLFTDYYAEQSCTAGCSSFITGQIQRRRRAQDAGNRTAEQVTGTVPAYWEGKGKSLSVEVPMCSGRSWKCKTLSAYPLRSIDLHVN